MAKGLFAIYDKENGVYVNPQFQDTRISIMRGLMIHLSQQPESALAQFPESFAVYYLGDYDEVTGNIKCCPTPAFVEEISNLMPKTKKKELVNDQQEKA